MTNVVLELHELQILQKTDKEMFVDLAKMSTIVSIIIHILCVFLITFRTL